MGAWSLWLLWFWMRIHFLISDLYFKVFNHTAIFSKWLFMLPVSSVSHISFCMLYSYFVFLFVDRVKMNKLVGMTALRSLSFFFFFSLCNLRLHFQKVRPCPRSPWQFLQTVLQSFQRPWISPSLTLPLWVFRMPQKERSLIPKGQEQYLPFCLAIFHMEWLAGIQTLSLLKSQSQKVILLLDCKEKMCDF